MGRETVKRLVLLPALVVVLAPSAPLAGAQDGPAYVDAVGAWATAESLRRLLPDSSRAGREPRQPAKTSKPTKAQLAKLRFKRDPAVTQSNNQAIVDQLGPGYDPAVVVADIERNRGLVHQMLRSFSGSWSPNDVADIAATALLSGYAAYTGKTQLSSRGSLAVRAGARAGLAASRRVRALAAERKQTVAEMTEIRLIYLIAGLNAARAAGDAIEQDSARSAIRGWIRDVYSLDIARVKLTKRGFVTD
jgi:hypothetical protein